MAVVRVLESFATGIKGYTEVVRQGDLYEDDDPLVRAYPAQFEAVVATHGRSVEQATAAPGEARNVRRPR
jgi:hypothetical protein